MDRTRLAHERTLMACVRTATSLISFGFTIYKFFEFEAGRGIPASRGLLTPRQFGMIMIGTSASAQTVGQFLRATTAWGLPPFAPATQSLQVMNQGSLVLDLSAKGEVVWRGVAQAQITIGADDKKREALLREGVKDLPRRFPPKQ